MKIIKKPAQNLKKEAAHGGSGSRKLLVAEDEITNIHGMTYGYLPAGSKFAWHSHERINEAMLVIKGEGTVKDQDGKYIYEPGDTFIFPSGIEHEIENPSREEHEFIFVRIKG
jgi:quercetin dioxygenase-like cupin family protein